MLKVLHVDNSMFFKRVLDKVARKFDIELLSAASPKEALQLLEKEPVDVVITALEFREGSGFDLIREMNENGYERLHKAILTGRDTIELRRQADVLGVNDYIQKDISLSSLAQYFEEVLNCRKVAHRLERFPVGVYSHLESTQGQIHSIFKRRGIFAAEYLRDLETLKQRAAEYSMILLDLDEVDEMVQNLLIEVRTANMASTIIALSSSTDPETISDLLLSGADEYLGKPISEKLLMARVNASVRLQSHVSEIREQKKALEKANLELKRLVITDALTQVYNRMHLMHCLEHEINRGHRYGRNVSLAMFDIDRFKSINDGHGHQVGDEVLQGISAIIKNSVRDCDVVGRYGGEEFMVILPECVDREAYHAAERIRANVAAQPIGSSRISVTISGGVCSARDETVESLVRKADKLLYQAKRNGRNRVETDLECVPDSIV